MAFGAVRGLAATFMYSLTYCFRHQIFLGSRLRRPPIQPAVVGTQMAHAWAVRCGAVVLPWTLPCPHYRQQIDPWPSADASRFIPSSCSPHCYCLSDPRARYSPPATAAAIHHRSRSLSFHPPLLDLAGVWSMWQQRGAGEVYRAAKLRCQRPNPPAGAGTRAGKALTRKLVLRGPY